MKPLQAHRIKIISGGGLPAYEKCRPLWKIVSWNCLQWLVILFTFVVMQVFIINSFVHESLFQRSHKIVFRYCSRGIILLFSFTLEFWYKYDIFIVEINHKIQNSFKTLTSKKAARWYFKTLKVTINFHEK